MAVDLHALARELTDAYTNRQIIPTPPSGRAGGFDLQMAYAVEAELTRMRRASGRTTVGRKVGYANKAVWRALKLDTLVWAQMYDDTVRIATGDVASLSLERMCSPKIEPEIVFKLRRPLEAGVTEPAAVLDAVDWLALGFEIIDCVYADWKFQPSDFVAAFGLHAALIVGSPLKVESSNVASLAGALPRFTVGLTMDGQAVAEGSGRNSLRSPALCLGELASAIASHPDAESLGAGELVSSGTLTESQPIANGQTWTAAVAGIDLPALTLRVGGQTPGGQTPVQVDSRG
jgi:2-oxo-3-hexenedioate decarboxylase